MHGIAQEAIQVLWSEVGVSQGWKWLRNIIISQLSLINYKLVGVPYSMHVCSCVCPGLIASGLAWHR